MGTEDSFSEMIREIEGDIEEFSQLCTKIQAEIDRRDALLISLTKACVCARTRFSDLNGRVSREVWEGNYEAVNVLDEAVAEVRSFLLGGS